MVSVLRRVAWLGFLLSVVASASAATGDSSQAIPWKVHLQSRFSLAQSEHLMSLWGASVGYVLGAREHEITLGYTWAGGRGTRQLANIEKSTLLPGTQTYERSNAGFVNVGFWLVIHNSRRWKIAFPLEVGLGRARARPYSLADEPLGGPDRTGTLLPLQAAGYVEWKAARWGGIGLQLGYRHNLLHFGPVSGISGPYGRFRVLVYTAAYRDWYRRIFKGERLPSPFFSRH